LGPAFLKRFAGDCVLWGMTYRYSPLSFARLCLIAATLAPAALIGKVTEVRLWENQAEIVREVVFEGPINGSSVVVDRLPSSLERQAITVRLLSGGEARLGGIRFERVEQGLIVPSAEQVAAAARVSELEYALEDLRSDWNRKAAEVELIQSMREALLEGLEEAPSEASLQILRDLLLEEIALTDSLKLAKREAESEEAALEQALKLAQAAHKESIRADNQLGGRLHVDLIGEAASDLRLEVVTLLNGAGWNPVYRVNALPEEEAWEFTYGAGLRNPGPESWESVKVRLFTGQPGWRTEAPQPPTVFLAPIEDRARPASPFATKESLLRTQMDAPMAAPATESELLGIQFSITPPQAVTVERFSNGVFVTLKKVKGSARFWSAVTPMVDARAYLHGKGEVPFDWPILPGSAVLLVEGSVTGKGRLSMSQPGSDLELGFGENPAIQVERTTELMQGRDGGVFDKVRRMQRRYVTTLENLMPVSHQVKVHDRIPVSRDAEIEVRLEEPSDVEVEEGTGRFTMERTMAPGTEVELVTAFEVVAPRDWKIPTNF
jgi:uncharacterized protein (TIGR02231 family)